MNLPTINDLPIKGKRVLVRVDYNVPLNEDGTIKDDERIRASLPTLKLLFEKGARQLVLMTHIGRPKGQYQQKLTTDKVALRLMKLIGKTVHKIDDCIDRELPDHPIIMLENLRFHQEEEENDDNFSRRLAQNGDLYVNDAFGTAHRAHASTVGVTRYLKGAIGLLIEKELRYLNVEHLKQPLITILGGAKLATKLPLIQRLLPRVERLLLGGAMIFTFYKAQGWETGTSLVDENNLDMAKMLHHNDKLILPTDIVVAKNPDDYRNATSVPANSIPKDKMGLDLGEQTINTFIKQLANAKTIIWNGPLGYVEQQPFDHATTTIMNAIAELTDKGVTTIIGGGDSISMVNKLGIAKRFTHVSTGGGASMQLLEGKPLPALTALEKQQDQQK